MKIDQAFIRNPVFEPRDQTVATAAVGVAHRVKLRVAAEDVEDEPAQDPLTELGCGEAEGFHLHRPAPATDPSIREARAARAVRAVRAAGPKPDRPV